MCQFPKVIRTWIPYRVALPTVKYSTGEVKPDSGLISITVPCGHCLECKRQRASEWRFRLAEERKDWEQCAFITLTYTDDNLPVYDKKKKRVVVGRNKCKNGISTLNYNNDVKKFFDRLRYKKYGILRFRYYSVSEYGFNGTLRPHYHLLVFYNGLPPKELHATIEKVWAKGTVTCTSATVGRIDYVSKYACGGCVGFGERYEPPRARCSNRPAIGSNWLDSDLARTVYNRAQTRVLTSFVNKSGQKITYWQRIPRYYLRKMAMTKCYEDMLQINKEQEYKMLNNPPVPEPKVSICGGLLSVSQRYYNLCRDTFSKLVKQHEKRPVEQHIKFDFKEWMYMVHEKEVFKKTHKNYHVKYLSKCQDLEAEAYRFQSEPP